KHDEIAAIDGVDIVLGSEQKLDIVKHIDEWRATHAPQLEVTATKDIKRFGHSCSRGDRTRYFLKVQDGCDYYCSYCTIPYARGRSRSGTIADLVDDARRVADEGGKEIIITGVNIGDFGKNTGERFIDLVKALDDVKGVERYRISSIEPDLLSEEVIDFVAESRSFMPHFHIPLQCGSDEVLRIMRRHYDTALFADKVAKIKSRMPHAFIGVDLIVGMRGETEEEFLKSYEFCNSLDITRLHVFPYSERPGTLALRIEHKVSPKEKAARAKAMIELSDRKLGEFTRKFVGTERDVLFEQPKKGMPMHGFTDNYLKVELPYEADRINTIGRVRLGEPNEEMTLAGAIIK
ncbi:MAG: MiaB/RimO family radical SAM methylthiotransferase, partial [Muribaculaceae bacterium]|nr:MiaB/RimO family radical SAM methylthiotransferase [Muribaculaceae bacterium]